MTDKELWAIEQRMENGWAEGDTYSDIQAPADVATLLAEVRRVRADLLHARHSANAAPIEGWASVSDSFAAANEEGERYVDAHTASDGWEIGDTVGDV